MFTLLLIGVLTLTGEIKPAKSEWTGTVYIRADGSIDPPDAPIVTYDNITYTLTDNITSSENGIVIERDNIVVDGAGYTIQSTGIGIDLPNRSNVTIENINIEGFSGGYGGIRLDQSSNIRILGNNITGNSWYGIYLYESSYNILKNNHMVDNEVNFGVFGSELSHFLNDVDASNTVDGKPIYYWVNKQDMVVPLDAGYVALVNCTGITVQNLHLTKNVQGVLLAYTTNSTITQNNITNNWRVGIKLFVSSNNIISGNNIIANSWAGIWLSSSSNNSISGNQIAINDFGIWLDSSSNNTVSENHITDNSLCGVYFGSSSNNFVSGNNMTNNYDGITLDLSSNYNIIVRNNITNNTNFGIAIVVSSNNRFWHNNFVGNTQQVHFYTSGYTNVWDDGYPSGGNYWSDYTGIDANGDGIGDTPYVIDADNQDRYPLIHPWSPLPVHNINTGLGYETIQEAINAPETMDGHTIFVEAGTYYEDVVVNKTVSLIGEDASSTILDGEGSSLLILSIVESNVTVSSLTVKNTVDDREAYGIMVKDCENVSLRNVVVTKSYMGIILHNSSFGEFVDNAFVSSFAYGIYLRGGSSNNTFVGNLVSHNVMGVHIDSGCQGNLFHHNNFVENTQQLELFAFNNKWDNGCEGNFWSNYNGSDLDGDGIGDTYLPWKGVDNYPLMNPYWNPGDVNHDLKIDIYDVVLICVAYGTIPSDPEWNPHADIAEPYGVIDIYDVVRCTSHYGETYP